MNYRLNTNRISINHLSYYVILKQSCGVNTELANDVNEKENQRPILNTH